ncbi:hypothetical protein PAPYR_1455 [Paratrimastix pyriformis]|uniref:Folate receptor-like domain-containing protein n=1 Tax=Paratrimastix pyriformis TaxID=342808 RepID=A0ABQ8URP0_9EUKA|nr:hypothetical protein PAPYR_1455 [Paratrimastix pyriformis]
MLLALFLLGLFAGPALANTLGTCPGTCTEPSKGVVSEICKDFVNYPFCITDGVLMEDLVSNSLKAFKNQTNSQNGVQTWSNDCIHAFLAYQCGRTYKKCSSSAPAQWLDLCHSTCENYVKACGGSREQRNSICSSYEGVGPADVCTGGSLSTASISGILLFAVLAMNFL